MTIKCLILGCQWKTGLTFWSNNELLLAQNCTRKGCGSCRTVAQ
jgi:hypothetical protein